MKKNYIFPHNIVIDLNGADAILNSISDNPDGFNGNLGGGGSEAENDEDLGRQNNSLWDAEW